MKGLTSQTAEKVRNWIRNNWHPLHNRSIKAFRITTSFAVTLGRLELI